MTSTTNNPWVERFLPILDRDIIYQRACVPVEALQGLDNMPPEPAARALDEALQTLYIPNKLAVDILYRLAMRAYAHSKASYTTRKDFLRQCYSPERPPFEPPWPICLTGPAGAGKSALLAALTRVVPADDTIEVDRNHSAFEVRTMWSVRVRTARTLKPILASLVGANDYQVRGVDINALVRTLRKTAYQEGVSLLTVDEFQFQSRGSKANTFIVSALSSFAEIGLPLIYAANYSLCHKLMNRPQEDRQRLLSDPIVLTADLCDSDWVDFLRAVQAVAPCQLRLNPEADAQALHRYTGGLRRLVRILVTLAYRGVRESGKTVVGRSDLESAYHSTGYTANRNDVEAMIRQSIKCTAERPDLSCPFKLPKTDQLRFNEQTTNEYQQRISRSMLEASMTNAERQGLARLEETHTDVSSRNSNARVVSIKKKRPTAAELTDAARDFQEDDPQ